jgi:hypothetical protein
MALVPVGDKVKVLVAKDQFGLKSNSGAQHGTVVAVPEDILYFGFHSFGFDNSLGNKEVSKSIQEYYSNFLGKIVFWEELQDRGRRFQDGEEEFVLLNMSDIIAYEENEETTAYLIQDVRSGGFKV